jgi:hypothetical protein
MDDVIKYYKDAIEHTNGEISEIPQDDKPENVIKLDHLKDRKERYERMLSDLNNLKINHDFLSMLPKLYYNYGRETDKEIRDVLKTIKIVKKEHKGIGSVFGYYPLNKESILKISRKPRKISMTFDATETENKPLNGVVEGETIHYLVKSTSRFFLKPDFGEICDQIGLDLYNSELVAICINEGYETIPNTDGEHHIMTATLLMSNK